jgi:endonuclease/exonuclease/phosphatase (EEP) superfamily protein YafD
MTESAKLLIFVLGYVLVVISFIPLIRNDNWMFRIFEYPRFQKLIINVIILFFFAALYDSRSVHDKIFGGLLLANFGYLFYQIWPYTFFSKRQMIKSKGVTTHRQFKLLISNIFQDNRDIEGWSKVINRHDPDLLLIVETDEWWKNELERRFENRYPYRVIQAQENTYGMVLFSKFELMDAEVKFLIEDDVPSIEALVKLPSAQVFKLYCLHPKPPVPHETARSTERDAEILLVAKEAEKLKVPVIVAGDLNDVAWSYTTELFLKVSKLLDPRRGRGFYNTFHARHWFFRWPLDHVFCSTHFELASLTRLPSVGSDHFPILIELVLSENELKENKEEVLEADSEEKKFAEEKIKDGKQKSSTTPRAKKAMRAK